MVPRSLERPAHRGVRRRHDRAGLSRLSGKRWVPPPFATARERLANLILQSVDVFRLDVVPHPPWKKHLVVRRGEMCQVSSLATQIQPSARPVLCVVVGIEADQLMTGVGGEVLPAALALVPRL